jgi:hypothetical protein
MGLLVATALLGGQTILGQSGPSQMLPEWTVCIDVENSAGVSLRILDNASKTAGKLLQAAGIPTEWEATLPDSVERLKMHIRDPNVHAPTSTEGHSCLILSVTRGTPRNVFPDSLGFALPHAHSGADVTIFYDRIELLEWRPVSANATTQQILGYAIAHEIGHVLLGSTQHSPIGIMKGPWRQAEFQLLAKGGLGFTAQQCELMRKRAFRRAVAFRAKDQRKTCTLAAALQTSATG